MSARTIVVAVAVAALLAWMFRYDISGSGNGYAYKLDRWTGGVSVLYRTAQHDVESE